MWIRCVSSWCPCSIDSSTTIRQEALRRHSPASQVSSGRLGMASSPQPLHSILTSCYKIEARPKICWTLLVNTTHQRCCLSTPIARRCTYSWCVSCRPPQAFPWNSTSIRSGSSTITIQPTSATARAGHNYAEEHDTFWSWSNMETRRWIQSIASTISAWGWAISGGRKRSYGRQSLWT